MRMKKFLTFLLTLAMVVSMLPAAAFAANNTATTMRLAKTQGTVAVTNATGKKVTQTSNMKLYNGYKIKTGAKSYAWISLDNTKAAKLDANSVVSVQKNGQKLTLYLSSGNLFFNVKDPLKSGESFHIKTSTMTTGIRGTSGCVRVINDRVTEIHLLTGQVEVYTENPELNISKMAVLKAGQKATSLIAEEAMAATGKQADIIIEQLTHEEVCGNCSKEIAADPALVERIEAEAPHLLPDKIADEAEERLEADEEKAEEKQAAIDKAVDNQTLPEDVDPYFEKEESSSGGGGGSSAPVTPSTVVSVTSWDEFVTAVNNYNSGTDNITIKVDAEIDQGTDTRTATVQPTANGNTLTIDLTTEGINMNSTIVNNGNLVVTNTAGHIITEALTVLENNGTFILDNGTLQTLVYSDVNGNSPVVVKNNGDFEMNGGAVRGSFAPQNEFASYCGVMNDGTFTMSAGTIDTVGYAIINGENAAADLMILGGDVAPLLGVQNINGTATVTDGTLDGTFYNEDELIIQGGIWTASYGALVENNSTGTMTMTGGTMHILTAGGYGVSNSGTATLSGGNIYVRNGAVGVESIGTLVMNGGIRVRAYDGTTGVRAENNITLGEGAAIWAYGTATAVTLGGGDGDVYLSRPVKADIGAETETKVIVPLYPAMAVNPGATDPDTNQTMYDLVDNYGKVTDGQSLAEMIQAFNQGNIDVTIKLEGNINVNSVLPVIGSASDTKVLTIDLNGKTLTLSQPMENAGNLLIDDSAGSGSIAGTANPLISNTGNLELAGGNISLKEGQTGVTALSGTVTMSGGSIDTVDATGGTTGILANGVVDIIMKGGNINVADNNMTNSNATGIKLVNANASLDMQGGTISVTSTRTDFPAGYNYYPPNGVHVVSGSATLTGGTVKAEGTRAQAVNMAGGNLTSQTIGTDITATASDRVWIGTLPGGYEVAEATDGNKTYYRLQVAPTGINTWAEFVTAVTAFNNSTDTTGQTILLSGDVNPTSDEVMNAGGSLPIGNANGTTLTIDLNGKTLTLPTTLTTGSGSALVINGGTNGKIVKDADWDTTGFLVDTVYLIENNTTLTLNNVNISSEGIGTNDVSMYGFVNNKGTLNMESGQIDAVSGYSLCGIMNSGTLNMNGGTINATNGQTAIDNNGTAYLNDGTINVSGVANNGSNSTGVFGSAGNTVYLRGCDITVADGAIGIAAGAFMEAHPTTNAVSTITVNSGTGVDCMYSVFTMNDGIIDVKEGTGVSVSSENVAFASLNGGTIMASVSGSIAATVADGSQEDSKVTVGTSIIIKAKDPGKVYTPAGYTVTTTPDAEGYYHMVSDGINTWAELMAAVADFNAGTTDKTITLTDNIDPTDTEVASVTQLSINNVYGNTLTLDLGLNTLALPATLEVTGSSVVITADSGGDVEGTITTGQEWVNVGGPALISNEADLELAGGSIIVPTGETGVYNEGTFEMSGGYVAASGGIGIENANDATISGGTIQVVNNGIGVYSANMVTTMTGGFIDVQSGTGVTAFNPFVMEGGQIVAIGGTGLSVMGATTLTKGEITADYDAVAVSNRGTVTMGEDMTVRATVADNVMTLTGAATLPAGYVVSAATDGEGYFHLTPSTATVPMNVSDWEGFVNAVNAFNTGTSAETITLMADIDPTYTEVAAVTQANNGVTLPPIGNGTSTDLTINLGGRTLGLPATLATNSSSGLVIDGTGTITTGQQWNNSDYLINNSTDLTLKGGTIAVPHNVIGVNNTGTFEMKGGDMEILYSTGIQNAKDVILGGGTITLREDNTNYSNGGTDAIGYQAYAGIGSASTLEMDGTNITIEQGILYYFNDGNDDVYSPPAGIYNEAGTVTYTSGDMLVGTGVGISNSDTLIMNGGIITVNESATAVEDTATGIESFGGTFTMNDGAIDASRGTGLRIGGTAALKDGTVSATMYATAVESYSANVTMGEQMTIRGSEADQVYVLGTGGALPAGYEVSDTLGDDGYYHLEALYSAAAEEFVQAVNGWDGTAKTITLTESITVDYDVLYALGYDALEVPEGTGTLTIDLDTYTLTLETPLVTNSNMIVTYDGVGEGSAVYVDANEQAGIIVNGGTTQLMGGYISGSDNTPLVYVNAGGTLAVNGAGTVIVPGEGGIGITVNGGTAMVNDGIVEALGDNTIAVEVYSGTLNVSDNADIRAGNTYTNDANNYAIYDHGGTITILGGEISAYLYDTNSYALYSDQTTWNSLTVNTDNATVTGPAAANVITPTHGTYEAAQGTDYWKLQDRSGGGNGE